MADLIRVDGSQKPFTNFTLKGYQEAVADGDLIQVIHYTSKNGSKKVMIMDEEGKLKGKPMNQIATILVEDILFDNDYIAGDVIIAKYPEEFN